MPDKVLRFECHDKGVRYAEFECGEYGSFTFTFPPGAYFLFRTGSRDVEFRFHDVKRDVPPSDVVLPVKEPHTDRRTTRERSRIGTEENSPLLRNLPYADEHYSYSMPAVSALLAAIAGTIREFDEPDSDLPATNWILETMMHAYPKFVEADAHLDEEERDEAMLLYAIFHQMCFPEEAQSS